LPAPVSVAGRGAAGRSGRRSDRDQGAIWATSRSLRLVPVLAPRFHNPRAPDRRSRRQSWSGSRATLQSGKEAPMPLRDHFRPPVEDKHSWEELHGGWPMVIVQHLFPILPEGYVAAPSVHLGAAFEIDV